MIIFEHIENIAICNASMLTMRVSCGHVATSRLVVDTRIFELPQKYWKIEAAYQQGRQLHRLVGINIHVGWHVNLVDKISTINFKVWYVITTSYVMNEFGSEPETRRRRKNPEEEFSDRKLLQENLIWQNITSGCRKSCWDKGKNKNQLGGIEESLVRVEN